MNWNKVIIGGVVGGIALNLAEFVMHGIIMAGTYAKYPDVFTQEASSPFWFLLVSLCIALVAAILFAKTRACWAAGVKGGVTYGFLLGLFAYFSFFYDPLVLEGFPYYLAWCQGAITLIALVILGAVLGLVIKKS